MQYEKTAGVSLFTDGACSGNPGKGGWAAIIKTKNEKNIKIEKLSGAYEKTTNNRMELMALIRGLENITEGISIDFYSDSQYIINALTKGWIQSWQKNGWRTSNKKAVANRDLWEKVIFLTSKLQLNPIWVRGHDGHPENEECDEMAVAAYTNGPYETDHEYAQLEKLF